VAGFPIFRVRACAGKDPRLTELPRAGPDVSSGEGMTRRPPVQTAQSRPAGQRTEAGHRRLAAVNMLIIDDLALTPLDETATSDFCELTVARHG
jgi:hypothetical protein